MIAAAGAVLSPRTPPARGTAGAGGGRAAKKIHWYEKEIACATCGARLLVKDTPKHPNRRMTCGGGCSLYKFPRKMHGVAAVSIKHPMAHNGRSRRVDGAGGWGKVVSREATRRSQARKRLAMELASAILRRRGR